MDIWGYKINWYDKEDGWTELRRNMILKHNQKMMKQIKNMPAYTKYGYQKMKIPVELYNFILQSMKQISSRRGKSISFVFLFSFFTTIVRARNLSIKFRA